MACINMYNNQDQYPGSLMSPRISFSNDFVRDPSSGTGGTSSIKHERSTRELDPSAPDFEFSALGIHSTMIPADEAFSKGRLLPLKENPYGFQRMTLRDELEAGDVVEGEGRATLHLRSAKAPKSWRELLGLRKAPPVPKKHDRDQEEINCNKPSQEARSDAGGRHDVVEIAI